MAQENLNHERITNLINAVEELRARVTELEKFSHEPQEIHPRVVAAMGCEEVKALIREALK